MKMICSIVRDLLPNYIENLVSDETKQYVDNHIIKCEECRQILKDLKGDNAKEVVNNLEEEAEARIIKKHKRIKFTLKVIAVVLLVILLISFICFCIKFIPINWVRLKAYNKIQELGKLDNYKITVENAVKVDEKTYISIDTYYYLNGRYKITRYFNNQVTNEMELEKVLYFSDGITSYILTVDEYSKTVDTGDKPMKIEKGKVLEYIMNDITRYSQNLSWKISMSTMFDLREDTYDNKNYYVLTTFYKENYQTYEIWINKDTMLVDRTFCRDGTSTDMLKGYQYKSEKKYKIEPNVVTYEDVKVPYDELNPQEYNIK